MRQWTGPWRGLRRARPAGLCGVGGEPRKTRGGSGICLSRRGILDANQGQGVAPQDLLGLGELRLASELSRPLQVEDDRRVMEETGTAPHLLGEFGFEAGIAQHSGAHHHDGEDCALHEIARHPKYATRPRPCGTLRVNPKSCPPQPASRAVGSRGRLRRRVAMLLIWHDERRSETRPSAAQGESG